MRFLYLLLALALLAGAGAAAYLTRGVWMPWLVGAPPAEPRPAEDEHEHAHAEKEATRVRLSPQARANLGLDVRPVEPQAYWRKIWVPGVIIDRPGQSDRGVTAPVSGVVTDIRARPGDTVAPGAPLFTIRILSEVVQNAQAELYKTLQEIEINAAQRKLLEAGGEAIAEARIIELNNQEKRLRAAETALRQELRLHGLRPGQIDAAAKGDFATEVVVEAPQASPDDLRLLPKSASVDETLRLAFEVQELKVHLGDQVQIGQTLCLLANHQALFIEGFGFKQEASRIQTAAREGWEVEATFSEEARDAWPELTMPLRIQYLANTIDPVSRTFSFYIPLLNMSETYQRDGRTYILWRFRPGQRVRLRVPVEEFENVFVLPVGAVVRAGAEAYVFRQNGDLFERVPVHVVYEDRAEVVIANDGSLSPGMYVARHGAAALQRALKAKANEGAGGHGHHGHDH